LKPFVIARSCIHGILHALTLLYENAFASGGRHRFETQEPVQHCLRGEAKEIQQDERRKARKNRTQMVADRSPQ
jgi:hypothetical protein